MGNLVAVTPTIGDYLDAATPRKRPPIVFRYDWRIVINEHGRSYFARINDYLVLNVAKAPGTRTWHYSVIGSDLTKEERPLILEHGTRGTMAEAKHAAEEKIPGKTPGTQMTIDEEVPF